MHDKDESVDMYHWYEMYSTAERTPLWVTPNRTRKVERTSNATKSDESAPPNNKERTRVTFRFKGPNGVRWSWGVGWHLSSEKNSFQNYYAWNSFPLKLKGTALFSCMEDTTTPASAARGLQARTNMVMVQNLRKCTKTNGGSKRAANACNLKSAHVNTLDCSHLQVGLTTIVPFFYSVDIFLDKKIIIFYLKLKFRVMAASKHRFSFDVPGF